MSARRPHRRLPLVALAAALIASTLLSVSATPTYAASKDAKFDKLVGRTLARDVTVAPKGGAVPCLHRHAKKALKKGKEPDAEKVEKACNVRRVAVSRIVVTTAPESTHAGRKATATTLVGLLRGRVNFARALDTHNFVAAATTTTRGQVSALALASTAPIKADPTRANGNHAPVPRPSGRIDYRSGDLTVVLDGTASSDDKQIVSYEWTLVTTTTSTPIGSGPVLVWQAPAYATHLFVLTVTDAQGARRSSVPMGLDVWRWTSRGEFLGGLRDGLNATRAERGLKALSEQSCLTQAAQRQADTLADQHTATPIDTAALAVTCKRAVRGVYTDFDEWDFNLRVRTYSSVLATEAMADPQTATYGLGFAHSKDGPGYYVVFLTAA